MDCRLLMTSVDDAEVLIRHYIQRRQDVIAGQGKNIGHPFKLEGFAD
jgi:hypothetical protein